MRGSSALGRVDVLLVAEKNSVARAFAKLTSDGGFETIRVCGLPAYRYRRGGRLWVSFGVSGHLMDYDFDERYNRWRSVDPRELFAVEPRLVVRGGSWKYVRALERLGRLTDFVILALDADTEGESIAFEVMEVIRRVNPRATFKRAWFSAVTKSDLERALRELREPNPLLANKSFARMQVDLTIGAAFTRALTLLVERRRPKLLPRGAFLSYGPCQSPVLYLVVERALERERFKSEVYYTLSAEVEVGGERLRLSYAGDKVRDAKAAEALRRRVLSARVGVVSVAEFRERSVRPPEPLNTVELERRASRFLNIRPKEALDLAEELYRDGLISYPRTETTIYPPTIDLRAVAAMFARSPEYGEYVGAEILSRPRLTPTRGSEDDRAHPPIYPTRCASRGYVLGKHGAKGWKLYDLVVRHFLATLSRPAVVERQRVVVEVAGVKFEARGCRVLDPGYFKIYPFEAVQERPLPRVAVGGEVAVVRVEVARRRTEPPPYLSESELLKLMKRYGIGTDATMQDHIHTNIKRRYFVVESKRCIPTELGKTLAVALHSIVPEIVRPEVRGAMERKLQEVALGRRSAEEVVSEVKSEFLRYYDKLMSRSEELAEALISALERVYGGGRGARAEGRVLRPSFMTAKEYLEGVRRGRGH